ncbi:MAG: hypothetical protein ABIW38_14615 [Ferruginibacter sp.]
MNLTPLGAQAAMLGESEKKELANLLISGSKNISDYTNGVCYDTVAYVRYLLNPNITPDEIIHTNGQDWNRKFDFLGGQKWNGESHIYSGTAVGFYRLVDNKVFHAAIGINGSEVRAVNGGPLGAGWQRVNLKTALGTPNDDGSFNYDGTKIFVYLSRL